MIAFPAHKAKIYGIDWSHGRRDELITCSLDKTIKIWDTSALERQDMSFTSIIPSTPVPDPKALISTTYPIWRARDLPFGHGLLSLPQRSETALEMFAEGQSDAPVHRYEGHTDVVKEFVWRRGGQHANEYQLITWSKDRSLKFWPVDREIGEVGGVVSFSNMVSRSPKLRGLDIRWTIWKDRLVDLRSKIISSPSEMRRWRTICHLYFRLPSAQGRF